MHERTAPAEKPTGLSVAPRDKRALGSKLDIYRSKRDFTKTREPSGDKAPKAAGHAYLIQKHAASRLHYDFRLEWEGVLKSWAVTRGPKSQSRRQASCRACRGPSPRLWLL